MSKPDKLTVDMVRQASDEATAGVVRGAIERLRATAELHGMPAEAIETMQRVAWDLEFSFARLLRPKDKR